MKLLGVLLIIGGLIGMSGSILGGLFIAFIGLVMAAGGGKQKKRKPASQKTLAKTAHRPQTIGHTPSSSVSKDVKQLLELGYDLAAISDGRGLWFWIYPDDPSDRWRGKIISLTGETPGYPTYAEAVADGMFHSGCTNNLTVVVIVEKEKAEERKIRARADREANWKKVIASGNIESCVLDMMAYAKENKEEWSYLNAAKLSSDAKLWNYAEQALDGALLIADRATKESLLMQKAAVYLSAGKPKCAAEVLIEAYPPLTKLTCTKTSLSKIGVDLRKALKALKVPDVKETCDELLRVSVAEGTERAKELLSQKCVAPL
jgi:hypothetical protein